MLLLFFLFHLMQLLESDLSIFSLGTQGYFC
jgi:hypothetical protein